MELNNREIAFLVWLSLIVGASVWKTRRRHAMRIFLCLLVKPPILYLLGSIVSYVAFCVWLLSLPGWWQLSNLKTSLLWTGSFALIAAFNYEKAASGRVYFRRMILETASFTALLSFVASSRTFGLIAELVITGLVMVLAATAATSEREPRLKSAQVVATALLVLLSLLVIGNSILQIAADFGDFATSYTVRELVMPVLLTVMFLPFVSVLYVYTIYNQVFNSFDFSTKDPALRGYTRRQLLVGFRLDTAGLQKWRRHVAMFQPLNKADVDASIRVVAGAADRRSSSTSIRQLISP